MLVLGLSSGHKLGLALVAGGFILFALLTSMVVPRFRPDFPGRGGVRLYVLASLVLFVGALAAVEGFAKEEPEHERAKAGETGRATTPAPGAVRAVHVTATEYHFALSTKSFTSGSYAFVLKNDGKIGHNLVVSGPKVTNERTPVISPGKTARLRVALVSGTYELYCAVPGHKQLGMDVKIKVS